MHIRALAVLLMMSRWGVRGATAAGPQKAVRALNYLFEVFS